jgi:hypothetical protein
MQATDARRSSDQASRWPSPRARCASAARRRTGSIRTGHGGPCRATVARWPAAVMPGHPLVPQHLLGLHPASGANRPAPAAVARSHADRAAGTPALEGRCSARPPTSAGAEAPVVHRPAPDARCHIPPHEPSRPETESTPSLDFRLCGVSAAEDDRIRLHATKDGIAERSRTIG